jgi:hypothetical protein
MDVYTTRHYRPRIATLTEEAWLEIHQDLRSDECPGCYQPVIPGDRYVQGDRSEKPMHDGCRDEFLRRRQRELLAELDLIDEELADIKAQWHDRGRRCERCCEREALPTRVLCQPCLTVVLDL